MCVVDRISKVGREQYLLEIVSAFSENDNMVANPFGTNATIFNNEPINDVGQNVLAERIFFTDNKFRDLAMHEALMSDLIQNLWDNRKFYHLYNPVHATYEEGRQHDNLN